MCPSLQAINNSIHFPENSSFMCARISSISFQVLAYPLEGFFKAHGVQFEDRDRHWSPEQLRCQLGLDVSWLRTNYDPSKSSADDVPYYRPVKKIEKKRRMIQIKTCDVESCSIYRTFVQNLDFKRKSKF